MQIPGLSAAPCQVRPWPGRFPDQTRQAQNSCAPGAHLPQGPGCVVLHYDSNCNVAQPSCGEQGLLLDCSDVEVRCVCLSCQLLAQAKGQNRLGMNPKGQGSILHLQRSDIISAAVSTQCCRLHACMSPTSRDSNPSAALHGTQPRGRTVNCSGAMRAFHTAKQQAQSHTAKQQAYSHTAKQQAQRLAAPDGTPAESSPTTAAPALATPTLIV